MQRDQLLESMLGFLREILEEGASYGERNGTPNRCVFADLKSASLGLMLQHYGLATDTGDTSEDDYTVLELTELGKEILGAQP